MPSFELTEWMALFSLKNKEAEKEAREQENAKKEAMKRNLILAGGQG